jgi:hypothetical protein
MMREQCISYRENGNERDTQEDEKLVAYAQIFHRTLPTEHGRQTNAYQHNEIIGRLKVATSPDKNAVLCIAGKMRSNVADGSCVTSIVGPNAGAQLYER